MKPGLKDCCVQSKKCNLYVKRFSNIFAKSVDVFEEKQNNWSWSTNCLLKNYLVWIKTIKRLCWRLLEGWLFPVKKAFPDFILFSNNWSFIGQLGTLSSQLNVKKRKFKFFKLSQNLDLNLASHGQLDDVWSLISCSIFRLIIIRAKGITRI